MPREKGLPKEKGLVMKIILVGGGKVGTALARQLSEEGHNVTVVETQLFPRMMQPITKQSFYQFS